MKYPFSPEILDALPEPLAELFRGLELTLLEEICSRLNAAGQLNEVTVQDIRALRSHGIELEEIEAAIRETTGIGEKELNKLLDEVVERNQAYYTEAVGLAKVTVPEMMVTAGTIDAIRRQTLDEYRNLTRSLGFQVRQGGKLTELPAAKAYQWALDSAELQVQSGAISYNSAIRGAVKTLADSGIKTVSYASGHVDQVDVAVRRAVMTGTNQLCQQYAIAAGDILETDLVEISAHRGARDTGEGPENHKGWQGKLYRWSQKPKTSEGEYPDFLQSTGYGTGPGLGGWNCRHHFRPFVEGINERVYTDEQLENIDPPPFEYEGKVYTAYEATQKQRQIERTIRRNKREQAAFKAAGLKEDAQNAAIKNRVLGKKYREFSKAAKLPEQRERMRAEYSIDLTDIKKFSPLKRYDGEIRVVEKFSDQEYVVELKKPQISGARKHFQENLQNKPDRAGLTQDVAQNIINSSKVVMYQTGKKNLKFLADNGYVILNMEKELVTAVPEKLRKKYKKYLGGK